MACCCAPSRFNYKTTDCCAETDVCMDTVLCCCCQVGRQCHAVETGEPNVMSPLWCVLSVPLTFVVMPCCVRIKVKGKYQLEESCCDTFFGGLVCGWCSLCMTHRELNHRGTNPGGCVFHPLDKITADSVKGAVIGAGTKKLKALMK